MKVFDLSITIFYLFILCSRGGAGIIGEVRIECAVELHPNRDEAFKELLSAAFDDVASQLPVIVTPQSSDVSGEVSHADMAYNHYNYSAFKPCIGPFILYINYYIYIDVSFIMK